MKENSQKLLPVIRQSYAATYMKQENVVPAVALRVRYRALQMLQPILNKYLTKEGLLLPEDVPLKERSVVIDLSTITTPNNYKRAKESGEELISFKYQYSDVRYKWRIINVFESVGQAAADNGRFVNVVFTNSFLHVLAQKGGWISFYDADIICSLNSVYSMRIYEMISRRDEGGPLIVPFETFKEYLGLTHKDSYTGKYGANNFDKKVMRVAMNELKNKAPYAFNFCRYKDDSGQWCYSLSVSHIAKNEKTEEYHNALGKKVSVGIVMPQVKAILTAKEFYAFTNTEIQNNAALLLDFEKNSGRNLLQVLMDKYPEAITKENPKAWIIGTLKNLSE